MISDKDYILKSQVMFDNGCAFSDCADFAMRDQSEHYNPDLMKAGFVNMAFACEMFLKSLLTYKKVQLKKAHQLRKLYNMLPTEYQKHIAQEVSIKTVGHITDMFGVPLLDKISDTFIKWRYWYEQKDITMRMDSYFLVAFRDVLKGLCQRTVYGIPKQGGES